MERLLLNAMYLLVKKADMIVVPSDVIYTKEKIFVSPSGGIDTKLFQPQEK